MTLTNIKLANSRAYVGEDYKRPWLPGEIVHWEPQTWHLYTRWYLQQRKDYINYTKGHSKIIHKLRVLLTSGRWPLPGFSPTSLSNHSSCLAGSSSSTWPQNCWSAPAQSLHSFSFLSHSFFRWSHSISGLYIPSILWILPNVSLALTSCLNSRIL